MAMAPMVDLAAEAAQMAVRSLEGAPCLGRATVGEVVYLGVEAAAVVELRPLELVDQAAALAAPGQRLQSLGQVLFIQKVQTLLRL